MDKQNKSLFNFGNIRGNHAIGAIKNVIREIKIHIMELVVSQETLHRGGAIQKIHER